MTSCQKDPSGRTLAEENLFSDFSKECSFILSSGETSNSGKAIITRANTNKIEFVAPETLSGICIESDETGNNNSYTLSIDNVSSEVPKSLMGKMSLMFLAISDEHALKFKKLKKCDFEKVKDESLLASLKGIPYSARVKVGDALIITTYDSTTGEILMQSASEGESCATIIYKISD